MCAASGPSFTAAQARLIAAAQPRWRVVVANNSWQRVPSADAMYAGDRAWWGMHLEAVKTRFAGECWTLNRWCAHNYGLHYVGHSDEPGLSLVHGRIHTGGNSGYAAIGLAYLFGARHIVLAGYDFQDTDGMSHWHGDHPAPLNPDRPYAGWIERMRPLIAGLQRVGVEIINCSIETAIDCIPRGDLETCLSSSTPV